MSMEEVFGEVISTYSRAQAIEDGGADIGGAHIARQHAVAVAEHAALRDAGLGYIKVDYNETIGLGCDQADSPGEGLRQHLHQTGVDLVPDANARNGYLPCKLVSPAPSPAMRALSAVRLWLAMSA